MSKRRRYSRAAIHNRLWKYRKRMGFTQWQAAKILGHISYKRIGDYERGRRRPGLVTALKLEIVYRVPVAFLFPDLYARLKATLRQREERLRSEWERHEAQAPFH